MATEAIIFQQIVDINWDQAIYTASPNNSINVVQFAAKGSGTNIGIALTPKGTGFISAQVPDGTTTGGNARGTRSVDFQTFRYAATQVASGGSSFLFPSEGSLASGTYSVAGGGNQSRALANSSFAFGGSCTCEGAATGSMALGNNCSVAGPYSFAIGDRNQAQGSGIWNAFALGGLSAAYRENMLAVGCWTQFNARGYAQGFLIPLRVRSSGDTPIDLVVGGSSNGATGYAFNVVSGSTINALIEVTGSKSDGTAIAYYTRKVRVQNIAGTTTLVRVETIGTDDASGTSISITADNATDTLKITVTGVSGETWNWGGWISGLETRVA